MDDQAWLLKSASDRLSPHFLISQTCSQVNANLGHYSHSGIAQDACIAESSIRQEPSMHCAAGSSHPGFSSKVGRSESGNSFLALLSGPSLPFHSEFQQFPSIRPTFTSGNSAFFQGNAPENAHWSSLTSLDALFPHNTVGHGGFNNSMGFPQEITSRDSQTSCYNRGTVHHTQAEYENFYHMSEVLKHGCRRGFHQGELDLHFSGSLRLRDPASIHTQYLQGVHPVRASPQVVEAACNDIDKPLPATKPRQHVFCFGTNKLSSGELVLSDSGRFGVICACHGIHMSVARFCEHSGTPSAKPGSVVHMENGESIDGWLKYFFLQLGVRVLDAEKFWSWTDDCQNETEVMSAKGTCAQNTGNENLSTNEEELSTVKAWKTSCSVPVYHNNSHQRPVGEEAYTSNFPQNTVFRGASDVHDVLLKNVSSEGMPPQANSQILERLKENTSRPGDILYCSANGSSHNYGSGSVAEYTKSIKNAGKTNDFHNPSGIKTLPKGFVLGCVTGVSDSVTHEKDCSSAFELSLGQPSPSANILGSSLLPSFDSIPTSSGQNMQKAFFHDHKLKQEEADPCRQWNITASQGNSSGTKEKLDKHLHLMARQSALEAVYTSHIKENNNKLLTSSKYQSTGRSASYVKDVPFHCPTNKIGDQEQLSSKLTPWNSDISILKKAGMGDLREKVVGPSARNSIQNTDFASFLSQNKKETASHPVVNYEIYRSRLFPQTKGTTECRLMQGSNSWQEIHTDAVMQNKKTTINGTSRLFTDELSLKNTPNLMGCSSNFGSGIHSEAIWPKTSSSISPREVLHPLQSAEKSLSTPRMASGMYATRTAGDALNKITADSHWQHQISHDQLRSLLDLNGVTQVSKSAEAISSIPNHDLKFLMDRTQGQLDGLFRCSSIPILKNSNQQVMRHSVKDVDKIYENVPHINPTRNGDDIAGPGTLPTPTVTLKECNTRHAQGRDSLSQKFNGTISNDCYHVSERLAQQSADPEEAPCVKEDLTNVGNVENVSPSREEISSGTRQASLMGFANNASNVSNVDGKVGATSTVAVSVGENDSSRIRESFLSEQKIASHKTAQVGCQYFQEDDADRKPTTDNSFAHLESKIKILEDRKMVEDHVAATTKNQFPKVCLPTQHIEEYQMSNVCSKGSDNVRSELSDDDGNVVNGKSSQVDIANNKLTSMDVVDEGSGIGKCCSSDIMDTGVWTRNKQAEANSGNYYLETDIQMPYSHGNVNSESNIKSPFKMKRQVASPICKSDEIEHEHQNSVVRSRILEKTRKTRKLRHLDATSNPVENSSRLHFHKNYKSKNDVGSLSSAHEIKTNNVQHVTTRVSPLRISGSKRKRSILLSNCLGRPMQKLPDCHDDQGHDISVKHVLVKGDKLVIKLQQGSFEWKEKQLDIAEVEHGLKNVTSKKASKSGDSNSRNRYLPTSNVLAHSFSEDKIKVVKCAKPIASKCVKGSRCKPTPKGGKIVSLRSILSCPEKQRENLSKENSDLAFKSAHEEIIRNQETRKQVKSSALQRNPASKSRETQPSLFESFSDSERNIYPGVDNSKELQRASVCESINPGRKAADVPFFRDVTQPMLSCNVDVVNTIDGHFHVENCLFPRSGRSAKKFKWKGKSDTRKSVPQKSSCTANCFPYCQCSSQKHLSDSKVSDMLKSGTLECDKESDLRLAGSYYSQQNTENSTRLHEEMSLDDAHAHVGDLVGSKKYNVSSSNMPKKHTLQCGNECSTGQDNIYLQIEDESLAKKRSCKSVDKKRCNHSVVDKNIFANPLVKRKKLETLHPDSEVHLPCSVCGDSNEQGFNRLVQCCCCFIKVHQACYGISKIPRNNWKCRACKSDLTNIVCVLCGYGGGAMTRATRTNNVVKSLLQIWKSKRGENKGILHGDIKCLRQKSKLVNEVGMDNYQGHEQRKKEIQVSGLKTSRFPFESSNNEIVINNSLETYKDRTLCQEEKVASNSMFIVDNTITAAVNDPGVTQWVHMVCGLWTPGTKCVNVTTMGVFDVSGATVPRKKQICSICNRPGGLCIHCRVAKCSIPFHPWCAHQKGLLQSEIEGDNRDKVGFYGRCMMHAKDAIKEFKVLKHNDSVVGEDRSEKEKHTCARTEPYMGCKSWNDRKINVQKQCVVDDTKVVSQEQINAWLHINGRKSCSRASLKPSSTDIKPDYRREYIRFKQEKRWRRLVVYKSGIHALGLYTAEFISKGEMVVEYVGEIVGLRVADKREAYYHSRGKMQQEGACYFFRIDNESIIDATRKGGIARFVNHSCSPNCVAKVISVKTQKKVVFFAERDINAGEEITYDYNFNHEDDGKKIPCFCKSRICRLYLN